MYEKSRKKPQLHVRFWQFKPRKNDGNPNRFLNWTTELKLHAKIIHHNDPCLAANDWNIAFQARVLNKHFQHSIIFRLVLIQKTLTCYWDNLWPWYCTSSSSKKLVWFSWWAQKKVEKRQSALNTKTTLSAIAPTLLWRAWVIHSILGSKFWLVRK